MKGYFRDEKATKEAFTDDGWFMSGDKAEIDKNGFVIVNGNKTKEFWDGRIRSDKKPLRLKIRNICGDETIYIL